MQQQPWQTLIKYLLCTKFSSKTHEVGASVIAFYGKLAQDHVFRIWNRQDLNPGTLVNKSYLFSGRSNPPTPPPTPNTHTEKAGK